MNTDVILYVVPLIALIPTKTLTYLLILFYTVRDITICEDDIVKDKFI